MSYVPYRPLKAEAMPFTRTATADEILADVALTQANIKSSSTITLSE
jgi:hypothetical protein